MSFEEAVRETIQKAKAANEKYEQEGSDFEDSWLQLRQSTIRYILSEAAKAFKSEGIGTNIELVNGSIIFHASYNQQRDRYHHRLTFRANKEKRVVIRSSSFSDDEEESFTLDHLTTDVVQNKVKHFANRVARGNSPLSDEKDD